MKKYRRLAPLFLLTLILITLFPFPGEAKRRHHARIRKNRPPTIVNQILNMSGVVLNNGAPAREFSAVKEGDILETAEKGFALVRIPGLGMFRLGEKTKFQFRKFMRRNTTEFELVQGELLAVIRREGVHQIQTARTKLLPNLASFLIRATSEERDLVVLFVGKLEVESLAAEKKRSQMKVEKPALKKDSPTPIPTVAEKESPTGTPTIVGGSPSPTVVSEIPSPTVTPAIEVIEEVEIVEEEESSEELLPSDLLLVHENKQLIVRVGDDGIQDMTGEDSPLDRRQQLDVIESLWGLP